MSHHKSDFSFVYWAVQALSVICRAISLQPISKRVRYPYIFMDAFVLVWLSLSYLLFYLFPKLSLPAQVFCTLLLLFYRITTMVMAHLSILFLGLGKTTDRDGQIHSRLRYLLLTTLNYFEFLAWSSVFTLWLQPIHTKAIAYSEQFLSRFHVLYYNFVTSSTLGYGDIHPEASSVPAQAQVILETWFSILILTVIVNIVVNIRPDKERVRPKE